MIRQIVQDLAVLEDSKIILDYDKFLVVKASDSQRNSAYILRWHMAYKPADELEKAAWTAEMKV